MTVSPSPVVKAICRHWVNLGLTSADSGVDKGSFFFEWNLEGTESVFFVEDPHDTFSLRWQCGLSEHPRHLSCMTVPSLRSASSEHDFPLVA